MPMKIAAFERAVKLDPTQPDAHYRLARLYTQVGQKQKAAREFAKTRELHSKTEDSLIQKVSGDGAPAPPQSAVQP
jgi:thioredoxin-like negative regulator of GroEL